MLNEIVELENKYSARRAIILARVSSKDQEEGFSIDAQKNRLENYCQRHGLIVDKIFEFSESSTNGDRRQFMAMINYAKNQRETIAIISDKVDRLQRSFKEFTLLDGLAREGKIELHFATENYVIHQKSASYELTQWGFGVLMAKNYVDSLRDNVKRSINQKIRLGEWIAAAPIGYINSRDEKDRSIILIDPECSLLVSRLFLEFSKGTCTVGELTQKAKVWGLKSRLGNHLGKSKIYQILNNPFYYGRMIVKGTLYYHCYSTLIDKALFDQCQAILKGRRLKRFKWGLHEFVFRGLLTCGISGKTVSGDRKRKKYANGNVGEWVYLRCSHPDIPGKTMWVREEIVLNQLKDVLKGFEMPSELYADIAAYIKKAEKLDQDFLHRQIGDLQREQKVVQDRIDGLMDLLLDRVISKDDFESKKKQLKDQKIDLEGRLSACKLSRDGFSEKLMHLLSTVSNSYSEFVGSQIERKRELLNFVFANLSLKGNKLLYSLKEPFEKFSNCTTFDEWRPLVDELRTNPELRTYISNLVSIENKGFLSKTESE